MNLAPSDRPTIPSTAKDWFDWLSREEDKTRAAYREKPSLMIADYRREQAIARDYEGREVLELLQNANDQAADAEKPGRVLLDLTRRGLIVANVGTPFSTGGVESLQTSHLSPKKRTRRRFIGNKGLGFRAILNWTRSPIILSGALKIAYSDTHADSQLRKMIALSEELQLLVETEQEGGDECILPRLQFPGYSAEGDLSSVVLDPKGLELLGRCQRIIEDGYDTVIGMPFDSTSAFDAALTQLAGLHPEILLFAEHLGEICFRTADRAFRLWNREEADGVTCVVENGKPLGSWRVFRHNGPLPAEVLESDQRGSLDYEIVVAVPTGARKGSATLFSYFPTDISIPLPVVCHATLELEQNRKHAQLRPSNSFVLAQLAAFLTHVAERVASEGTADPWAGCSLLMPAADYPVDLIREGFPDRLHEAARTRAIVPTIDGRRVVASSAWLLAGAASAWLPTASFGDIVPVRNYLDTRFFERLGVPLLEAAAFRKRVARLVGLPLEARTALICGTLQHLPMEFHSSAQLLDASDVTVSSDTRVFLPPRRGVAPILPPWMDLRFLSTHLQDQLTSRLLTKDSRELQTKLATFGLVEYSLANVIRALAAAANRATKSAPDRAEQYERDLLQAVFELYLAEVSEVQSARQPEFPSGTSLRIPSQTGLLSASDKLHLGAGYGPRGSITQSLFDGWAPEYLVAEPSQLGLVGPLGRIRTFVAWIGVAVWPREAVLTKPDPRFVQHVLRKINYPADFGEKTLRTGEEARYAFMERVSVVENLQKILQNVDPTAIAAWLALDDRAARWQRMEPEHGVLKAYPDGVNKPRHYSGGVPSYTCWCIEGQYWLRSDSGGKLRPKDCVLGERAIEEVFPKPAMPDADSLNRYSITHADLIEGWKRSGVVTSLAYLDRDEVYAKLAELPQLNPDGRAACSLYRWLLSATDSMAGDGGAHREAFLSQGQMWGRQGAVKGYFPLSDLRHVDSDGLPEALLSHLRIVDLPKRVGAEKVQRLFGVASIDRALVAPHVTSHELAVGSPSADSDFQAAKPYLFKLRSTQIGRRQHLEALKDLRLKLCSHLEAVISYEGDRIQYQVPVWGWLIQESVLYVRTDPADPVGLSVALLSDAAGEALASLFRLADGGDFARILACDFKDRRSLLRRMRGESADEDIDALTTEFATTFSFHTENATFPVPPVPVESLLGPTNGSPTPAVASQLTTAEVEPSLPTRLEIHEEQHVPAPDSTKRRLTIRSVIGSTPGISSHRVTDGDFCERKVLEFESEDEIPRFPLLISHITGYEAPGCDILSFGTSQDRENFRSGPDRNLALIQRFIEVKGRSDAAAIIELKGNELTAAKGYGNRYFIYRLFQESGGVYQLTVLQDPLRQVQALEWVVHVRLDRAATARRFSLTGGIASHIYRSDIGAPSGS